MLYLILFLSTFVGVNWVFCRSLFQENDVLPDSQARSRQRLGSRCI